MIEEKVLEEIKHFLLYGYFDSTVDYKNTETDLPILTTILNVPPLEHLLLGSQIFSTLHLTNYKIENLIFVAAACSSLGSKPIRKYVLELCRQNPDYILSYVYWLNVLSIRQKKKIWGHGNRKLLHSLYDSLPDLYKLFIRCPKFKGWSHKDVIRLCHYKPVNKAKEAIIQYFLFEKEQAFDTLSEEAKTFSKDYKQLTCTEDTQQAVFLLNNLGLTISHVPTRFQKSSAFWIEFLGSFPLATVVNKLEYFTAQKSLASVLPALINFIDQVDPKDIDPTEIFIGLIRYKTSIKSTKSIKAAEVARAKAAEAGGDEEKKKKKPKKAQEPVQPNSKVIEALWKLINKALKARSKSDKQWLVIPDLVEDGTNTAPASCGLSGRWVATYLTAYVASTASKTAIMSADGKTSLVQQDVEVGKVDDLIKKGKAKAYLAGLKSVIESRKTGEKKENIDNEDKIGADAILVLTDDKLSLQSLPALEILLEEYREVFENPHVKLVYACLRRGPFKVSKEWKNLILQTFEPRIPQIITKFSEVTDQKKMFSLP